MTGHFSVDVDPEGLRSAAVSLESWASRLEEETGCLADVAGLEWKGATRESVVNEAGALSGHVTTGAQRLREAAVAVRGAAVDLEAAVAVVPGLNVEWDAAQDGYERAVVAADDERNAAVAADQGLGVASAGVDTSEADAARAAAVDAAVEERYWAQVDLGSRFAAVEEEVRGVLVACGDALASAVLVDAALVERMTSDPISASAAVGLVTLQGSVALADLGLAAERRRAEEGVAAAQEVSAQLVGQDGAVTAGALEAARVMLEEAGSDAAFRQGVSAVLDPAVVSAVLAQADGAPVLGGGSVAESVLAGLAALAATGAVVGGTSGEAAIGFTDGGFGQRWLASVDGDVAATADLAEVVAGFPEAGWDPGFLADAAAQIVADERGYVAADPGFSWELAGGAGSGLRVQSATAAVLAAREEALAGGEVAAGNLYVPSVALQGADPLESVLWTLDLVAGDAVTAGTAQGASQQEREAAAQAVAAALSLVQEPDGSVDGDLLWYLDDRRLAAAAGSEFVPVLLGTLALGSSYTDGLATADGKFTPQEITDQETSAELAARTIEYYADHDDLITGTDTATPLVTILTLHPQSVALAYGGGEDREATGYLTRKARLGGEALESVFDADDVTAALGAVAGVGSEKERETYLSALVTTQEKYFTIGYSATSEGEGLGTVGDDRTELIKSFASVLSGIQGVFSQGAVTAGEASDEAAEDAQDAWETRMGVLADSTFLLSMLGAPEIAAGGLTTGTNFFTGSVVGMIVPDGTAEEEATSWSEKIHDATRQAVRQQIYEWLDGSSVINDAATVEGWIAENPGSGLFVVDEDGGYSFNDLPGIYQQRFGARSADYAELVAYLDAIEAGGDASVVKDLVVAGFGSS